MLFAKIWQKRHENRTFGTRSFLPKFGYSPDRPHAVQQPASDGGRAGTALPSAISHQNNIFSSSTLIISHRSTMDSYLVVLPEENSTRCVASAGSSTSRGCSPGRVRHYYSCTFATINAGTAVCRSATMMLMVTLMVGCGVEAFSDVGSRGVLISSPTHAGLIHTRSTANSSARPRLEVDVTMQSSKFAATSSVLFASSVRSSPGGDPSSRRRAARILASLFARVHNVQSSLSKHTKTARRIIAVLLLATAVFLGGVTEPALAGRSGGRAGGSFGRSYRAPPPMSLKIN